MLGGGEEIRTLAPAKPTYRISNPDPSTTWVHLHVLKIGLPIHNLLFSFFEKLCPSHERFMLLRTFPKTRNPLQHKELPVLPHFLQQPFRAISAGTIPMPLQKYAHLLCHKFPALTRGFSIPAKIFSPIPLFFAAEDSIAPFLRQNCAAKNLW